jgi:UDP-glucuronate decarboxylase
LTGAMETAWVRLFYQYGPYEHERRVVASVITALLRGETAKTTLGEQVRDFLHVEDVASAILAVTQSSLRGPVNIGSGKPVTIREIVAQIGDLLNRPEAIEWGAIPYHPSDPMFICANNRLLKTHTDWKPRYNLRDGLEQTIEWWLERLKANS